MYWHPQGLVRRPEESVGCVVSLYPIEKAEHRTLKSMRQRLDCRTLESRPDLSKKSSSVAALQASQEALLTGMETSLSCGGRGTVKRSDSSCKWSV